MKNNKGFTMVEVLAAIVIMGLLTAIAIVSVSTILDKAEKNHYETQQKNMIMAAQSYAQDNRNVLPKEIGSSKIIMLRELQNRKYIGDVLDRSKISCNNGTLDEEGSYVEIFRYSKDGYSYRPYLKCRQYETAKEEYGGEGPTLTLTVNENYNNPSFTFGIEDETGKIISYSYAIYKYDLLVKDSGRVPVSRVKKVDNKNVSLKELVPGQFKIILTATNMYGKTSTKTATSDILDENGPECINKQGESTTWSNIPGLTITVGCSDTSGSGCSREIFSQYITEETRTISIEISDKLGNKTPCEVNTYIDRTAPTKPVISNPYEGVWINKNYSINIKSTDVTAGIKHYEYRYPDSNDTAEREWKVFETSVREGDHNPGEFSFDTPDFTQEREEYIEIRACDYAGNCSETTKSLIKLDKTNPTCTLARSNNVADGENGWYVTKVTINMTNNDPTSAAVTAKASPINYELTTSTTPVYTKMNTSVEVSNTSEVTYTGYIKDEAGNATSCTDTVGSIKVDTENPVCKLKMDSSTVSFESSSDNINLVSKGINKSTTAEYGTNSMSLAKTKFYGHVLDDSGRVGICSLDVISTYSYTYDCNPYSCNPYQYVCGSYQCGAYCHTYSMTNAHCYACGLGGNCCGCSYNYCDSYCTGYHTCYETCTAYACNDGYTKYNNSYCYKRG